MEKLSFHFKYTHKYEKGFSIFFCMRIFLTKNKGFMEKEDFITVKKMSIYFFVKKKTDIRK